MNSQNSLNNNDYYNWILRLIRSLMFNCIMTGFCLAMSVSYLQNKNFIGFGVCGLTGIALAWSSYKLYTKFEEVK